MSRSIFRGARTRGIITRAAPTDWKAASWLLQRMYPNEFGSLHETRFWKRRNQPLLQPDPFWDGKVSHDGTYVSYLLILSINDITVQPTTTSSSNKEFNIDNFRLGAVITPSNQITNASVTPAHHVMRGEFVKAIPLEWLAPATAGLGKCWQQP
jgi:hypothetical protein